MKPPLFAIPLRIMKHKTEIFENCTLQQACEWIAFKIPPMEQIRANAQGFKRYTLLSPDFENPSIFSSLELHFATQADKDYSKQIYDAAAKLKLALYDGDINAYGVVSTPDKQPQHQQITNIPNTVKLDIGKNTIQINNTTYTDIYIPFQDLKREFHSRHSTTAFNAIEKRYSTPYMEIMVEVINELKITDTNQPLKKILTDVIIQKMTEHGLRPSQSLAEYMATIIRLPESQKGHA